MKNKQIVNIINFIRAVEPREPIDLVGTVREQVRLMRKHGLRGTFLVQYDVLVEPAFVEILRSLDPAQFEIGVWYEIVQGQTEACGIPWRGRYPWDWHTHCGFSVGYTLAEREALLDVLYKTFRETFGYYPRVFGSWLFDSHTVRYLSDTYGVDALCNCKEQFGTDGYTLWGGYYGQGYYPSSDNVFLPAKGEADRIHAPLFRMLGSDPVYQYDYKQDITLPTPKIQSVLTLEPSGSAGADPRWVDWYMRENFNGECLSFGYTQAGQENSFGWDGMREGLLYQFALFEKLQNEGKILVEPLGDSGRRYKATYTDTPPSAIVAHTAFDDDERSSVWYSTKHYRVNLYGDHGAFRIRDIHVFGDVLDPYGQTVCRENHASYEALPVIDGMRYSGLGVLAGGFIVFEDGTQPCVDDPVFTDNGDGRATVNYGELTIKLYENGLDILAKRPFVLENRIGVDGGHLWKERAVDKTAIELSYLDVPYRIGVERGCALDAKHIRSDGCVLSLVFA